MSLPSIKNIKSKLLNGCRLPRLFAKDNRGVAAIEFALIAPVMIAFYFGLSEISIAIAVDRDVTHATSVAGDLATQVIDLDRLDVVDVMTAALTVLSVNSNNLSDVTVELNSYEKSGTNITRIGYARMGPAISAGGPATYDPSTLGNNLLSDTSGVVVARVNYKYKPTTLVFMKNVTLSETFILKPRKSLVVPFDEGGKSNFSCTAQSGQTVTCTATN